MSIAALLKLSLRNLMRSHRRTWLALLSLAAGVVSLLLAGGFIEWTFWAMRESTIQSRLGHIQVVKQGFMTRGTAEPFAYLLDSGSGLFNELGALPEVRMIAPRLQFNGLVSHGEQTVSFIGEGIVPEREAQLSHSVIPATGEGLRQGVRSVFMGEGLAGNLGVTTGDTVVLLVTPAGGGMQAVELTVSGLFYTSTKAYDDTALRVPIDVAEELLRIQGAHRWLILLDDTVRTDAVVAKLRARLETAHADLEVLPWHELAEFYKRTERLFSKQMAVIWVMIGAVIALGISTLLIRTVIERTREIGTLLAIGLRRRDVLMLFLTEGIVLGVAGAAIGLLIGIPLALLISHVGIPMPPPPGMNRGFTGEIRVTLALIIQAVVLAGGATLLASLYPAWRASRLSIVAALRHQH